MSGCLISNQNPVQFENTNQGGEILKQSVISSILDIAIAKQGFVTEPEMGDLQVFLGTPSANLNVLTHCNIC